MQSRKEIIDGLDSLLKMMYDNVPEDKKEELDKINEKLERIKDNEEKLKS